MKSTGWLGRAVDVFILVGILNCSPAQAALPPEIQKGLDWLQSQVQADGSLASEAASIAAPLQSRSETLTTLKLLATTPASLADAVVADNEANAEYLARRIIALNLAGMDAGPAIAALIANQNLNGGFGGATGHESNPLDTAWALLALKVIDTPGLVVSGALWYLQISQGSDGAFRVSDQPDIHTSAMALQAFAAYSSQYALSANIQATVAYLQAQKAADGGWADSPFLSAEAYLAVHDFIPLSPTASELSTFLLSKQLADGSWDSDPYATALALRALTLAGSTPANPSLSILRGKVVDAQTGLPLSGVAVALTGGTSVNLLTQADGVFEFRELPPGDYALQLTFANYGAISATTATQAGQIQDMGILQMGKSVSATTGTVEGKVADAVTGQSLSGATVTVDGTISATTDASGLYQISNIPAGAVTLEASMAGYVTASRTGNMAAGGLMVFSPALTVAADTPTSGATIHGTVTSAVTGLPLAAVNIAVSGAGALSSITDAQGEFSITGIAAGAITVIASLSGYDTVIVATTAYGLNSIAFSPKMYPSGTTPSGANTAGVSGVVLDAGSNAPLANVSIGASYGGTTKTLQSGPDGFFNLTGISDASVDLKFMLAGYQASTIAVALEPLAVLDIGQVRLSNDNATTLLPDLTVKTASRQGSITDQQALAVSGSVSATITNIGSATAPAGMQVLAFHDTNLNGAYDPGVDAMLGQLALPAELAAGAEKQAQITVQGTLPFRDAPIHIWVDSAQSVAELKEDNNVGSTAMSVEIKPNIGTFRPVLKWGWSGSPSSPNTNWVLGPVVVGQLNDDNGDGRIDQNDIPDLVFAAGDTSLTKNSLVALSGLDGKELWVRTNIDITHRGSAALADIDSDGIMEIVISNWNRTALLAFEHDGKLKWRVPSAPQYTINGVADGIAIADLDHDGHPEIIQGNRAYNSDGSLRWQGTADAGGPNNYFPNWGNVPIIADVHPSLGMEVIAGRTLYDVDGRILWHRSDLPGDGFNAVGNFNDDPLPEIVLVTLGRVYLLSNTGQAIWGPVSIPGGGHGGPPTIADFDGDGRPDIGVAGATRYVVFNADGSIKWAVPTQDLTSNITGSSLFDFEGDGKAEVLYADEINFYIFDGKTGARLWSMPNTSVTTLEYPNVVDVDNDGHADIILTSNPYGLNPTAGIRVLQDANNSWVNTRKIWNQHSYHITNINDDGSVPRVEQNSWEIHNTYRLNAQPGISATTVPDLTASYIRVQDRGGVQPSTFTVRVGNGGGQPVKTGIFVAFYNGKPEIGGMLLGTSKTTLGLGGGEYQDIDLSYSSALNGIAELVVVADDNGSGKNAISDFDRANNRASLLLSALPGSFSIQVATDQADYGPNSPVAITVSVVNAGSFDGDASVRLSVETADGSAKVAILPATTITVAKTGSQSVSASWNTGATYIGAYRVKAELLDAQSTPYADATDPFGIGATLTVAAKITTDKQSSLPTDSVNIVDRISNLTQNQMLDDITAITTVYQPDGGVLWTQTATLGQLLPAAYKDLNYGVNLAMVAAGAYRAVLSVRDTAGAELARSETTFTVASSADTGSGLKGSITATPRQIPQGDQMMLSFAVENLGNADMAALPLTVTIAEPAGQTVLASWTYNMDILQGKTAQGAQNWLTDSAKINTVYVAVVTVTIGGKTLILAQDSFTVIEPPVKLDVGRQLLREGRLLLLLTCKNGESGSNSNAHTSMDKPQSSGNDDSKENGEGQQCITDRTNFMEASLTTQGIPHLVTTTLNDFLSAFRSGKYNFYWISGGAAKLENNLIKELREAVNRGDSVLLDGVHDERNKLLDEVAGVVYRGKLSTPNQPITLTGPVFTPDIIVPTSGQPLKYILGAGTLQATFPVAAKCDDCEDDNDKNATSPGDTPAIVSNAYGKGYGIAMAFDLIGSLMQDQPASPAWQAIMQTVFGHFTPQVPDTFTGGAYAVTATHIANLSQAVNLAITDTLPQSASVVSTIPQATLDIGGSQANWNINLAVDQSNDLTLAIRAPDASGSYTLTTAIDSVRNSQSKSYGSYPLTLNVASAIEPNVTTRLIADLNALGFTSSKDRENRDKAVQSLQDALTRTAQGKIEDAIGKLLNAVDNLNSIISKDMSEYRLAVDRWLQETELDWLLAQQPGPIQ